MTELEALKKNYPTAFYESGEIWLEGQDEKPFVNEKDTIALLNDHYDGSEMVVWSGYGDSNNPENETKVTVEGHVYIQEVLGGNYEQAFNEV